MSLTRRAFLKWAGMASPAILLLISRGGAPLWSPTWLSDKSNPWPKDAELPLQGSPYLKSCDGLIDYNRISFAAMERDIIHFRMPAKWRDRFVLGLF